MSRALISPQRLYEQVQCCQHSSLSNIMMSRSELVVPGDQLQYNACIGATLTTVNEGCY